MNGPQQSPNSPAAGNDGSQVPTLHWAADDDVALGFESANPALQIERWGQEGAAAVQETH